jgi:hypothetical protein
VAPAIRRGVGVLGIPARQFVGGARKGGAPGAACPRPPGDIWGDEGRGRSPVAASRARTGASARGRRGRWGRSRCSGRGCRPARCRGRCRRSDAPPPSRPRSRACRSRIGCRDGRSSPAAPGAACRRGPPAPRPCGRPCLQLGQEQDAGVQRAGAVVVGDHHRAGAAIAFVAALLGAGQAAILAQPVEQGAGGGVGAGEPAFRSAETRSRHGRGPPRYSLFESLRAARCGVERATRVVMLSVKSGRGGWQDISVRVVRKLLSGLKRINARGSCAAGAGVNLPAMPMSPDSSTCAPIPNIRCWKARCRSSAGQAGRRRRDARGGRDRHQQPVLRAGIFGDGARGRGAADHRVPDRPGLDRASPASARGRPAPAGAAGAVRGGVS